MKSSGLSETTTVESTSSATQEIPDAKPEPVSSSGSESGKTGGIESGSESGSGFSDTPSAAKTSDEAMGVEVYVGAALGGVFILAAGYCLIKKMGKPKVGHDIGHEEEGTGLTFSVWLSEAGFEGFEQRLVSDDIGVGENSWRTDIKEIDLDLCKQVGMSAIQVTCELRGPIQLICPLTFSSSSPFFSFLLLRLLLRLLRLGGCCTGEEVRPPGGPCDQLAYRLYPRETCCFTLPSVGLEILRPKAHCTMMYHTVS
jgi:hypothetical protein